MPKLPSQRESLAVSELTPKPEILNKASSKIFEIIKDYNNRAVEKLNMVNSSNKDIAIRPSPKKSSRQKYKKSYYLHQVELANEIIETSIPIQEKESPNKAVLSTPKKMTKDAIKELSNSSFLKRKLYGSQWYLQHSEWNKSMQMQKMKQEFLFEDLKTGSKKNKHKLELQRMLESMHIGESFNLFSVNPFKNTFQNFGSMHLANEGETGAVTNTSDLHTKFIEDMEGLLHQE